MNEELRVVLLSGVLGILGGLLSQLTTHLLHAGWQRRQQRTKRAEEAHRMCEEALLSGVAEFTQNRSERRLREIMKRLPVVVIVLLGIILTLSCPYYVGQLPIVLAPFSFGTGFLLALGVWQVANGSEQQQEEEMENARLQKRTTSHTLLVTSIALILLLLWTGTTFYIAYIELCSSSPNCQLTPTMVLTPGLSFVNATVGGLVSALVISRLAVTRPGSNPATKLAREQRTLPRQVQVIASLYLVTWLFVGLLALLVGVILLPEANATLKDAGATWLGIAVAAAYAYFGIDPD